ncbi:MAG TPA: EpsI family protein [Candidatus Acidoferrales bacterium]|nr:EpsI family protein [Candidatus Acidoferrales bacterium]
MPPVRFFLAVGFLVVGLFVLHGLQHPQAPTVHRPLAEFPGAIGGWRSRHLPFDAEFVRQIGADDYTNREYFGGARPVELYIGYYQDQRAGEAIHSPRNCLPGEGWEPVRSAQLAIASGAQPAVVNEYIVAKGARRDIVLYWYETRGRVMASEYRAKFWLVADGVRNRPTDGALIRIWTTAADGEASAERRAAEFARLIYPQVTQYLPH